MAPRFPGIQKILYTGVILVIGECEPALQCRHMDG